MYYWSLALLLPALFDKDQIVVNLVQVISDSGNGFDALLEMLVGVSDEPARQLIHSFDVQIGAI